MGSRSGAGEVTFTGAIGATHELSGLDVNAATAGSGDITFSSNIGVAGGSAQPGVLGTTAVGTTTTENIHFAGSLYSVDGTTTFTATTDSDGSGDDENIEVGATVEFKAAGTETLTFAGGKIDLADGANLTINNTNGAIVVSGVAGHSDETVTINAGTSTVALGAVGDSGNTQIHNLTVTGDGGITLSGNIYTSQDGSAADITFNDTVNIQGTVVIDSDDASNDGTITFTTGIDGADGTGDNLTIEGGTAAITLQPIGVNTALSSLTIGADSTSTAVITLPNIGSGLICLLYTSDAADE